ncbi:hypothetical protein PHLH5_06940 [Pseudomonas sp. Cab53]|nr:hypothetical protein PHLH5_06940 [Pseudomonas sp. Cab53]
MEKLIPDPPVPPLHLDIAADPDAERVIDSYLNANAAQPAENPSPDLLFTIVDGVDAESLLANLSETLASANVMAGDLGIRTGGLATALRVGAATADRTGPALSKPGVGYGGPEVETEKGFDR